MTPEHWETLRGLLSFLSSMAPNSKEDSTTFRSLELEILQFQKLAAEQQFQKERALTLYAHQQVLPHRTFSPRLYHDGLQWVAVAEFTSGDKIVGRGDSPNAALSDFDNQWLGTK